MKREDKKLLLIDLYGRLPYNFVYCYCNAPFAEDKPIVLTPVVISNLMNATDDLVIKPYLRPMHSMTEEEKLVYEYYEEGTCNSGLASELIDWLNKNMFDYRDLICKGLALKAPEGMYDQIPYRYFPDEFSSYEDYIKYLKEKGLAIEAPE